MSLIAFTRTLIVAEVRRQLGEPVAGLYADADIQRWIDISLLDIASKTRCLRVDASGNTTAATQWYDISATCLGTWAITRFEYNGKVLKPVAFDQIDTMLADANSKSLSSQGTPLYYIPYGRKFGLWPSPSTSGTYHYWFAKASDTLSADAMSITALGFSLAHGAAVESFCVRRGFLFAGQPQRAEGADMAYKSDLASATEKEMADNVPEAVRGSG